MALASKLPQRKKYLLSCLFRKEMSIYQVNLYFVTKSDFALLDQLFSEILRTHFFHLFNLIGWREQVILFEIDCAIFYTNLHELFCQFTSWTNWVNSVCTCNCLKDVQFMGFSIWKVELFFLSNLYLIDFGLHVHLPSLYFFLTFFKMKVL